MRTSLCFFFALFFFGLLAPAAATAQSKNSTDGISRAMNPKLNLTVRDYIAKLPLDATEASKHAAGEPFFTYAGGDSLDIGIGAHQFPNGSVVFAIQTQSPDLPVTKEAPRQNLTGVGADWYIVHFDPATGETFFASYYGTDEHDWLGDLECEDISYRCIFGGSSQGVELGKVAGPHDLFIAIMGFIDPVTLEAAYDQFCTLFNLEPSDWFSNAAFWLFLSATAESEASGKTSAIPVGAGICGFWVDGDRINGLVAIVDLSTCQVANVLESTFDTDDTFLSCTSDTGLDGTPFPVVTAVGMRDNDANQLIDTQTTSTLCYAHQNDTEMICSDVPSTALSATSGKTTVVVANDEYQDIQRDPDLGTFALGWNSTSGFGFIDYWASVDPEVVSSAPPLRVNTDFGHPFAMHVSNMGRVSFSTEWWDSNQYFGQRIGTYMVTGATTTGKTSIPGVGSLAFMNWTALAGVNRGALTTDIDDYPFMRGYAGASWFGIETSPTAIQSECPSGQDAVCASFGQVTPGLSYVSACNMTANPYGVSFATLSPAATTDSGFFFGLADAGDIEPNSCSRMYSWPTEGGFDMNLSMGTGQPIAVSSQADGISGPFTTVIIRDQADVVDVNDAPTIPRTFAVYITNILDESIDLTVSGNEGTLFSVSLDPLRAAVYNADPAQVGTTVSVSGVTAAGLEEVYALDLPDGDFVLQSLIAPEGTGKRQLSGFEFLVFNAMGARADTRVVTATEHASDIPSSFALHENFPNPFNPVTTLTYDLPHSAEVRLIVFDALGRQVESLVTGHQSQGRHSVRWEAKGIPSGVYYYRIEAGGFRQTRKMTLLK